MLGLCTYQTFSPNSLLSYKTSPNRQNPTPNHLKNINDYIIGYILLMLEEILMCH